jgi:hypothetical protein
MLNHWLNRLSRGLKSQLRISAKRKHQRTACFTFAAAENLEDRTMLSAITIDPGDYAGRYRVPGGVTQVSGVTNHDLAPGDYSLQLFLNGPVFSFNVGADGSVTSDNSAAAEGVDDSSSPDGIRETLRFNTQTITIDPGLNTAAFHLNPVRPARISGLQTVELIPGLSDYYLSLQHGGAGFKFDVDAFGHVHSQVAAAATGVGSTLHFNTKTITIAPGALTANYGISFISPLGTGIQTHELLPGLSNYYIHVRQPGTDFELFQNFHFDIDDSGNVSPRDPVFATGTGSTLAINTHSVNIDPGDYAGGPGIQNYHLPADPGYLLWLHHGGPRFSFGIDASGEITSANPVAAESIDADATPDGIHETLRFNTTPLAVDPGDYTGTYSVQGIDTLQSRASGFRSGVVLAGLDGYVASLQHGGAIFHFNIDNNGNAVSQNAGTAIGDGSTLRFQTTTINVDPGSYTGTYKLPFISPTVSGHQSFELLPGLSSYYLSAGGVNPRFNINTAGEPDPASLSLVIGGESFTFLLSAVTNVAPSINSAAAVDAAENQTTVVDVQSTDPDGETEGGGGLTYGLTGGADQALFSIDENTGELAFIAAPDFETPGDADSNNVYDVRVTVTDAGGLTGVQDIAVTVTNQASITGQVFVDVDQDGLFDANEPGLNGVTIELLDASGTTVLDTVFSSDGGFFIFEDLNPATYRLREVQPTGVDDGAEILGSLGGSVVSNDTMQLTLNRTDASAYAFAEFGQQVTSGDAAPIGFWQNKHGQALINSGGTELATWLSTNFANVFGNVFDNASVADFYKQELFKQKSKKSAGPAKVAAQFMATAMATYFTSSNLAGTVAVGYGFNVTETGIGTNVVNVGANGAAFGVADNTNMTIMAVLLKTNELTGADNDGDSTEDYSHIYDANGDGVLDDEEKALRAKANALYSWINESGDI